MIKKIMFSIIATILILISIMSATASLLSDNEFTYQGNFTSHDDGIYDLAYYDGYIYGIGVNTDVVHNYSVNGSYNGLAFNFSGDISGFQSGYGLCFDGTYFFISEYQLKKRIYQFYSNGSLTGLNWSYTAQDGLVSGLDCDGTYVYGTTGGTNKVVTYDYNGVYVDSFSVSTLGQDLSVINSYYYVSNGYKTIREFNNLGVYTGEFLNVTDNGRIAHTPYGMSWDGTNFYTSDVGTDYIHIWGTEDLRTLNIYVDDIDGNMVEGMLVETREVSLIPSEQFNYAYTDSNGLATFYPTSNNVIVSINEDGYGVISSTFYVPNGTTLTRTLTLLGDYSNFFPDIFDGGSYNVTGCEDVIQGVWLCGYSDITNCTTDIECETGRCRVDNHCSDFNFNLCDDDEMDRGGRCVIKQVFLGVMSSISSAILNNFLIVLIIVMLLLGGLILALRRK